MSAVWGGLPALPSSSLALAAGAASLLLGACCYVWSARNDAGAFRRAGVVVVLLVPVVGGWVMADAIMRQGAVLATIVGRAAYRAAGI